MPFKDAPNQAVMGDALVAHEHDILQLWKKTEAFERGRVRRKGMPKWSFIDGPITANNPMGVHHGWGRTYKDLFHRYWTMRGRETRYQNGFDCQGLWVEVEVERELGFTSKRDIEDYGLARFVQACKQRVLRYAAVQTEQSQRLGYWMDWNDPDTLRLLADKLGEDPSQELTLPGPDGPVTSTVEDLVGRLGLPELGGSYFTFSNENNYMIWRFLQECHRRGWLYRGVDSMPWCPRCATGISQHEIVTDGYQERTHRSVTLRLPLRQQENASLLVWTTTPWTLTSNVAAAVGPDLPYVQVRQGDETFYLSKGAVEMLQGSYEVIRELPGAEMVGWTYDGPFDELETSQQAGGYLSLDAELRTSSHSAADAHVVIPWDAVGEQEGTGIVHIAPGCGAEDFELGKEHALPIISPLDDEGTFVEAFGWLAGLGAAEAAEPIFQDLREKGLLYRVDDYTHRYPTCWRCGTDLVFRLVDEWFISMDELREDMMRVTKQIRWIPSFGLERELDWLRNMHDWMISKKRYWGLALPFWVCDDCGEVSVIGDERELKERAVAGWDVFAGHTPHRPYIDAIELQCPKCGGRMHRIPDVGNPWLDAGIVSFSTLRYRSDREYWDEWYPADWISESFPGQFRNWFYSLLAMGTVLDNSPAFRENFSYATLLAEDGRPMHKSWGNAIEFNQAADKMGVDVMRWLYCAHKPENNLLFGYNRADETRRRFIIPLWNVYSFLVTYANLDGWEPDWALDDPGRPEGPTPRSANPLDRWILARLNEVTARVTEALANSDPYGSTLALEAFLDDLTNWYVRRSRRRFWKSERDEDKQTAYATLYHVLLSYAKILAPFIPFITEAMYQNLVREVWPEALVSIHNCDWPETDEAAVDEDLLAQMDLVRNLAGLGLSARNSASIKVRQPLASAIAWCPEGNRNLSEAMVNIVADELNVKALTFAQQEAEVVTYRIVADGSQLGPRLGRDFPKVRAALAERPPDEIAAAVKSGAPVTVIVDAAEGGRHISLAPDEILVEPQAREGWAMAEEKGLLVAVDVTITSALQAEGWARDVIRQIQTLRKDADYELDQRITIGIFAGDGELAQALEPWQTHIMEETLATSLLTADEHQAWDQRKELSLDGHTVELAVRVV